MNIPIPDFYGMLGVSPDASKEQIESAWRAAIQRCHPDKFMNAPADQAREAEETTRKVNKAREVLTDPLRRAKYDAARTAAGNAGPKGAGGGNIGGMLMDALSWFATAPMSCKVPGESGEEEDGGMSPIQALVNINNNLERLNSALFGYVDPKDGEMPGLIEAVMDLTEAIGGEDELTDQISANTDAAEEALGKGGRKRKKRGS